LKRNHLATPVDISVCPLWCQWKPGQKVVTFIWDLIHFCLSCLRWNFCILEKKKTSEFMNIYEWLLQFFSRKVKIAKSYQEKNVF
jgi:hypothetical protein